MAVKKKKLGKGLNSLLSLTKVSDIDNDPDLDTLKAKRGISYKLVDTIKEISIDDIQTNHLRIIWINVVSSCTC